jgi:hypothetical protein
MLDKGINYGISLIESAQKYIFKNGEAFQKADFLIDFDANLMK